MIQRINQRNQSPNYSFTQNIVPIRVFRQIDLNLLELNTCRWSALFMVRKNGATCLVKKKKLVQFPVKSKEINKAHFECEVWVDKRKPEEMFETLPWMGASLEAMQNYGVMFHKQRFIRYFVYFFVAENFSFFSITRLQL